MSHSNTARWVKNKVERDRQERECESVVGGGFGRQNMAKVDGYVLFGIFPTYYEVLTQCQRMKKYTCPL